MSTLKWEEPTPDTRGRTGSEKWQQVSTELRKHPEKWALVAEDGSPSTATSIKKGRLKAFRPEGAFEAAMREVNKGRGKLYVRYIGQPDED